MAELDKIWLFQRQKGLSDPDLAEFLGVHRSAIGKWRREESHPTRKNLYEFERRIKDNSPVGESEKYRENLTSASEKRSVHLKHSPGETRLIPFYDAVAVGGRAMLADQHAVGTPSDMIDPGTFLRAATGSLRVYGHSMFPKYPAGCIVAYREADIDVIAWGEDYVIELSDRRVIKRIEKGALQDIVNAVSYNKSEEYVYATMEIPKAKIKRLFMVLGKIELEASI